MNPEFEIYAIGFRAQGATRSSWAAALDATAPDGRRKTKRISSVYGGTKNQAELVAVTMALECIKPEYRGGCEVVLHIPTGYAFTMTEKTSDGLWSANPSQNVDLVNRIREMINKYAKISIRKADRSSDGYRQCLADAQVAGAPNESTRME